jgi:uncharacterized membrane protein YkoI
MKSSPRTQLGNHMKNRMFFIRFIVSGFLLAAAPVHAQPAYAPPSREEQIQNQLLENGAEESRTRVGRREASELAREAFEGRVLSVRLEDGYWRIRMDQAGNVFNVFVDANSGRVSRPSE